MSLKKHARVSTVNSHAYLHSPAGQYRGAIDCFRQIYAAGGFRALYRGLGESFRFCAGQSSILRSRPSAPALMKAVPAVSIGYGAFEAAKVLMQTVDTK